MIAIRDVRKRFGEVDAVRRVSFDAADGTVIGLLGPNGAGKTTTLRMLTGLMRPDGGSIHVDGADVIADPRAAQRLMGVLPDSRGLYPRLTAREHIRYFGELHGLHGPALAARIDRADSTGSASTAIADRRVAGFSQGERTKVALARALVHEPRNVILDEPTNGLDVMSTRAVRELIRGLRQEGCCVRLLEPHHAGGVGALRSHHRDRARHVLSPTARPTSCASETGHGDLEDAFVALAGLDGEATA